MPVPVTMPEAEPIDATDGLALDQLPPVVAFDRVVVAPMVTKGALVIAAGDALMVIVVVLMHPLPSEYVMVAVPGDIPVTTPVAESTVAFAGLLVDQMPPGVAWLSAVVAPTQTLSVPFMAAVAAFTVTCVILEQPAPIAYVTLVVPTATPVTMPVEMPTVAFVGALLTHVPPVVVLESVIVWPTQTTFSPRLAESAGFTETV